MKIKRYTAPSMRAALALVRAEQGADAVILSSRRGADGIEVIAAVDYDEELFMDMNRQRLSTAATLTPHPESVQAAAASMPAPPAPAAAKSAASPRAAAPAKPGPDARGSMAPAMASRPPAARLLETVRTPPVARRPDTARTADAVQAAAARPAQSGFDAMQRQLQDLREMLASGLADMTWNDRRLREPLKARVLEELSALDIAPDVALALANLAPRRTTADDPSRIPLALLVKHLPVADDLTSLSSGVVALVGPTGAGKTTTIAKLAARWCMQHGSRDLALVSTDGYRIGARDQLMSFARILDTPLHAADGGRDLARTLDRLASKKLILIDTAGMGPRDIRLTEQLAALKLGAARARVLLALPAQGEAHALEEIVRAFARAAPVGCILTKVDEAASLGAVISTTLRHRLKIAYVCDGQRVPDDLHDAHQRRVWMARAAVKLKEGRPPAHDQAYFARHFGRGSAHA